MDDEVATSVPMHAGCFLHPILTKDFSLHKNHIEMYYIVLQWYMVFKIPRYTSLEL